MLPGLHNNNNVALMQKIVSSRDVEREPEVLLASALHMVVEGGVRKQDATREQRVELCTAKLTEVAVDANILVAQRALKAARITA